MKTHIRWIIIFGALCLVCAGAMLLMGRLGASAATVTLDGKAVRTLNLAVDTEFDVELEGGGHNHISVKNGKIAITEADCPDKLCVRRGYVSGGVPIVCLPHKLAIEFNGGDIDAATGR